MAESGYAPALHSCEHVASNVTFRTRGDLEGICTYPGSVPLTLFALHSLPISNSPSPPSPSPPPTTVTQACGKCPNSSENWMCLQCNKIFCGRFAKGHMVEHNEETGHAIACGLDDLSFWCYKCESYLSHLHIRKIYDLYKELHVVKFGEALLVPFEGIDEAKAMEFEVSTEPFSASSSTAVGSGGLGVKGLTKEQLDDPFLNKVLGVIYGNALGDAVGLATEFLDKKEVCQLYPDGIVAFPDYKLNMHNARWVPGDWTDDTDQMILIMESLTENGGNSDVNSFAAKLERWIYKGFPELGDNGGMGLGFTVSNVVRQKDFKTSPHLAATRVWERMNRNAAANGAVMRTSVLGCTLDSTKAVNDAIAYAKVTHHDARCVASCVLICHLISSILQGDACSTPDEVEALISASEAVTLKTDLKEDLGPHMEDFKHYLGCKKVEELKLDEARKIGYTLKCFASGTFALRRLVEGESVKSVINEVVREGGDADTNGAVVGGVLGAAVGYQGLPTDWVMQMPHKEWLDAKVVDYLKVMKYI